jgi:hypothetical protein
MSAGDLRCPRRNIKERPAVSMSEMSGALTEPLSKCAFRLRQYDILCKVLRLLREDVDEEPFPETWEQVRNRMEATPLCATDCRRRRN